LIFHATVQQTSAGVVAPVRALKWFALHFPRGLGPETPPRNCHKMWRAVLSAHVVSWDPATYTTPRAITRAVAAELAVAGHHAGLHDCAGLTGLAQNLARHETQLNDILAQIVPAAQGEMDDFPTGELATHSREMTKRPSGRGSSGLVYCSRSWLMPTGWKPSGSTRGDGQMESDSTGRVWQTSC